MIHRSPLKTSLYVLIAVACLIAVVPRIVNLPLLLNFSALGGLALLCGATLRPLWLAAAIPLGCRFLTDCILELQTGYGFYESMAFDYSAYVLICVLGIVVPRRHVAGMFAAGLLSAAVFFVVSNFGVWMLAPVHGYADSMAGLMQCYYAAIPFVRGTFMGDVVFSLIFLGVLRLLEMRAQASDPATLNDMSAGPEIV